MEKKKTYVLDTTVLIYDPNIFFKLGDADIVVPLPAIKELDGLKKSDSDLVAQAARQVYRTMDRISSYSDMVGEGGKLPTNAQIFIETKYEKVEGLNSKSDREIVGTALYLKNIGVKDLILVTTDTNMRIVGRAYGIKVEYMPCDCDNVDATAEINKNMDSFFRGCAPVKKRAAAKITKTVISLITTILITIVALVAMTKDKFFGLFFGLIIGGMVFMLGYAVYLRIINKNIPNASLKRTRRCFDNLENHQSGLWDTSFTGNLYFDSTNRGNYPKNN